MGQQWLNVVNQSPWPIQPQPIEAQKERHLASFQLIEMCTSAQHLVWGWIFQKSTCLPDQLLANDNTILAHPVGWFQQLNRVIADGQHQRHGSCTVTTGPGPEMATRRSRRLRLVLKKVREALENIALEVPEPSHSVCASASEPVHQGPLIATGCIPRSLQAKSLPIRMVENPSLRVACWGHSYRAGLWVTSVPFASNCLVQHTSTQCDERHWRNSLKLRGILADPSYAI